MGLSQFLFTHFWRNLYPMKMPVGEVLRLIVGLFDQWEAWEVIMGHVLVNERPQNELRGEGTKHPSIQHTDIATTRLNRP